MNDEELRSIFWVDKCVVIGIMVILKMPRLVLDSKLRLNLGIIVSAGTLCS